MTALPRHEKKILIKKHMDEGMSKREAREFVEFLSKQSQMNGKKVRLSKKEKKPVTSLKSSLNNKFKQGFARLKKKQSKNKKNELDK